LSPVKGGEGMVEKLTRVDAESFVTERDLKKLE
jgi:hypothetical protein